MTRQLEVARILALHGARRYGDTVNQLEHALQCAALARDDGADDEVVVAALLHDIGHLAGAFPEPWAADEDPRRHHGYWGALLVRPFVPARVAWLIEHHVMAKRYLCAVDRGYSAHLSPASARSLIAQGGPLPRAEQEQLERHPWFIDALRIRRWDDGAKAPEARPPSLESYLPLLARYFGPQVVATSGAPRGLSRAVR
jgi:predicted HD phosphohydrolase